QRKHHARSQYLENGISVGIRTRKYVSRTLTTNDSCADFISNLEVDLRVWSELDNLPCKVAPDVSTSCGEVPVSWMLHTEGFFKTILSVYCKREGTVSTRASCRERV